MYRVALCEDEPAIAHEQQETCRKTLEALNTPYELKLFSHTTELANTAQPYDMYILDIVMDKGGPNGMQLARALRRRNTESAIVFCTCHAEYALGGYEVGAVQYLMKPLREDKLAALILHDRQRRAAARPVVLQEGTAKNMRLNPNDILYFETARHKVRVHTGQEAFLIPGTLSALQPGLPGQVFCRCHHSFIVNVNMIYTLHTTSLVLYNGQALPVSRGYKQQIRQAIFGLPRGENN